MGSIPSRLTSLKTRRWIAMAITSVMVALTAALAEYFHRSLGDPAMATGWTLLGSTIGLYALGARKRAIAKRLGNVAGWLQFHTYLGLFALVAFAMHVHWPIRGWFESALATMFLTISLSGIVLVILSRRVPKQLSAVQCDIRLEDIPARRQALALEAHEIVLRQATDSEGATLAEYYQRHLLRYFHAPRSLLYRLVPTGHRRRQLLRELDDLDRYLDEKGRLSRRRLSELVIAKDDVDFHQALQLRVRSWFAFHIVLTWSLVFMIATHVILVLRFQGVMQ